MSDEITVYSLPDEFRAEDHARMSLTTLRILQFGGVPLSHRQRDSLSNVLVVDRRRRPERWNEYERRASASCSLCGGRGLLAKAVRNDTAAVVCRCVRWEARDDSEVVLRAPDCAVFIAKFGLPYLRPWSPS